MFNKLKNKVKYFFDSRFEKIVKTQGELLKNQQLIQEAQTQLKAIQSEIQSQLQSQMILQSQCEQLQQKCEKISDFQQSIYNQIVTTEQNLNYYGMIDRILQEYKYTNTELLLLNLLKQPQKRILIAGFFGADNLGDELMLQTLLDYFPKDKLSSVSVMLCDNAAYDYYHLPGVNFIHQPKNIFDCNLLAQSFDVLIWGGGALIDDCNYNVKSVDLNNILVDLSKRFIEFDKKVIALGLSTNQQLTNIDYIENLNYVCKHSEHFYLRDPYSEKQLKDNGIDNVGLMDDLVFYNKLWKTPQTLKSASDIKSIGVIWICTPDTEQQFKHMISLIMEKFGNACTIKLIPFYNHLQTDIEFYTRMVEELPDNKNIVILPYTNRIEKIAEEIADTDFMVNMRYHGMLMSNVLNKCAINICYDVHRHYPNKISYLSELFGIEDKLIMFSRLLDMAGLEFTSPKNSFCLPDEERLQRVIKDLFV